MQVSRFLNASIVILPSFEILSTLVDSFCIYLAETCPNRQCHDNKSSDIFSSEVIAYAVGASPQWIISKLILFALQFQ